MITIHYDAKNGEAVPDGNIVEYVDKILELHKTGQVSRAVSTGAVVNEFRLHVARQELSHTEVAFIFNEELITLNTYAVPSEWPEGFADVEDKQTTAIVRTISARRRRDHDLQKA